MNLTPEHKRSLSTQCSKYRDCVLAPFSQRWRTTSLFFFFSHMVEMKSNYICDCASFALKESARMSHHSGTLTVLRKPVARRDGANVQRRQSWVRSCLRSLLLGVRRSSSETLSLSLVRPMVRQWLSICMLMK